MLAPEITRPTARHRLAIELAGLLLVCTLILLAVAPRLADHDRQALTITNSTPIEVGVELRADRAGGSILLGRVPAGGAITVEEVWDVGDHWVLTFRGQGHALGQVTYQRADLDATEWGVEVPAVVLQQIDDLALPPSPR